ncbi:signal transduction histidine kinase [Rhodanobacter sp. TND4EL1]
MDMAADSWPKRLWQRRSLMQRMVFMALVPALITAALLATFLTQHQLINLRRMARNNAEAVATQAAAISLQPLRTMQLRELARIADSVGDLPQVIRVQIRTSAGQILADHNEVDDSRASTEVLTVVREVTDPDQPGSAPVGSVRVDVSLHQAIAAQHASLRHALVGLIVSLLLAAIFAWQAARWISAPLRHLAGAVHQLGRGDKPVVVPVTDRTEIGQLQEGFNHAAAALHDVQRGMQEQIEQATQELARKNAALEAASLAKSRFLAAAAHDLRQPLYALTLFSAALSVDEDDPQRLDRIAHVQECVQSLDHLFSELLDLSRLEAGAVQVDISEFPLAQVFAEVSRNFEMVAEQRDLQLLSHPTLLWVRTDRTMLTRILNNLVSNALRFTQHGGALLGTRMDADGLIRVEVWDTGSGIAPEHLSSVFDEFYRIDDHLDPGLDHGSRSGLGLGLATVQRLAQLLDTEVAVKSRLGRGSVFHLRLPMACATVIESPPMQDAPVDFTGKRVLVVDEDPAILSGVRFLLRSWGCDVQVAEDRLQAMEAVENWAGPPHIVISDLHLRGGTRGLDLFVMLDQYYLRDGDTPFARLLVTGETRVEHLRDIIAANIPLLYKPVSPHQLRHAMMLAWTAARADSE